MSDYSLPLEFNNRVFTSTEFAGRAYASGYPHFMQTLDGCAIEAFYSEVRELYEPKKYGRASDPLYEPKKFVWMCKGPQVLYVAPGKAFVQGCEVRVYKANTAAASASVIYATVLSYDEVTGLLWIEVHSIRVGNEFQVGDNKIPVASARVSIFNDMNVPQAAPRNVSGGGLASSNDIDGLGAIGAANIRSASEFFHDFISQAEGNVESYHIHSVGGAILRNLMFQKPPSDPANHPGCVYMFCSNGPNDRHRIVVAPYGESPAAGDTAGANSKITGFTTGMFIEFVFYLPLIATVAQDYVLNIGLCGDEASGTNVNTFRFMLNYTRSASANWRIGYGYNGAATAFAATASAVTTGWKKVRMTFTGAVINVTVNGVLILSISTATLGSYDQTRRVSFGHFSAELDYVAGGQHELYLDYLHIRKPYASMRGG